MSINSHGIDRILEKNIHDNFEFSALERIRKRCFLIRKEMIPDSDGLVVKDTYNAHSPNARTYLGTEFTESPFKASDGREYCSVLFGGDTDYKTFIVGGHADPSKMFFVDVTGRVCPFFDFPSLDDRKTLVWHIDWILAAREADKIVREPLMSEFYAAYYVSLPTDELVTGSYAKEFAGTAHWSRAVDFAKDGVSSYSGIRFIDFKDYREFRFIRRSDGDSVQFNDIKTDELRKVITDLRSALALRKSVGVAESKKRPKGLSIS